LRSGPGVPGIWSLNLLRRALAALLALGTLIPFVAPAAEVPVAVSTVSAEDVMSLDLEALANLKVSSVSKKEEKLTDAAAAITVVRGEDAKRSGATSIPEALRAVPGLHVGQIDARSWAISPRGFNNQFANKTLVLIDGRAVYTPLFAGTYWDAQNIFMDDLDRIEVIRGPGATVWGANAVNGVINVVTRSAKDTQKGLVYGGGGDEKQALAGARYGVRLNDHTWAKFDASAARYDDTAAGSGDANTDGWQVARQGFRVDGEPNDTTRFSVIGGGYTGESFDVANNIYGANLLGRWDRNLSERSTLGAQVYYDRTYRRDTLLQNSRDTVDATLQHSFGLGERQDVMWGLGYRFNGTTSESQNAAVINVRDPHFSTDLYSAFIQDEIKVVPEKLSTTLGTKIEHNDFTGWEVQPSLRLTYKPAANQTVWASVSRAVRTPSDIEGHDLATLAVGFSAPNNVPTLFGDPSIDSEELIAYELGYRIQPSKRVSVDVAAFVNAYDEILTLQPTGVVIPAGPINIVQETFQNAVEGYNYGGELSVTVAPRDNLRFTAWYALLWSDLDGPDARGLQRSSPQQ
ncbi:MAG TPA: TonB-dependent receptor, partial [Methylomirabilota bacterium]|nr:TonB-dependent receptor [Methylomirabilota bacterium]